MGGWCGKFSNCVRPNLITWVVGISLPGRGRKNIIRLAPVLKTSFHQCVISYTCSQSNSDGSVLRAGSTSNLTYQLSGW